MSFPIIGVVPSAKLFQNDDPYADRYEFVNSYVKRIETCGGTPLGILPNDGYVSESTLNACQSFVITGGLQIHPYHFQVVEHCYHHQKKLLGICLGMQTIHSFFTVLQEKEKRHFKSSLLDLYLQMKKEKYMFVLPVENHWQHNITRQNIDPTRHMVHLEPTSHLARILNTAIVRGSSMHRYAVHDPPSNIQVVGRSKDGSIEAIEYQNFILGVQFHPEVDDTLNALFQFLI